MSARPGPGAGHAPVSLSSECDKLRNEIIQLREELDDSIAKNEKLEIELEEAKEALKTALEKMKVERKNRVEVKCVDCRDVIEEPLCQSCLNAEQCDSRAGSGSEDIIVLDGDID